MRFCDSCGSFMETTPRGYLCPKCGAETEADTIKVRRERRPLVEPVYEMNGTTTTRPVVNRECPRCDSKEAYRMVLATQGEHAGVKQDRSVEKFTCIECGHNWVR